MKIKGFTLIELLVVIAIIAIIAAILFPVFAQVREKARQTSCASNEKQLGLAITQYTSDNDGAFPIGVAAGWSMNSWPLQIQPYVKTLSIFHCPDDLKDVTGAPWDASQQVSLLSYASNGYLGYDVATGTHPNLGVMGVSQESGSWLSHCYRTEASVARPGDSIMVAEIHSDVNIAKGAYGNIAQWGVGSIITGGAFEGYCTYSDIPDGTRTSSAFPNGPDGAISVKHHGLSNFLFCDGHVKALLPRQTNPNPGTHPELNMWDTTRS